MTDRPWPEDTNLSVYAFPPPDAGKATGTPERDEWGEPKPRGAKHMSGVYPIGPKQAYRGMPDDVALAAAVVDSMIWEAPGWVSDVAAYRDSPPPIRMSDDNEEIMAAYGWRDTEDIYDAAGLTEKQRQAVALHLLGWEIPAIADDLRTTRWNARWHLDSGQDKLHKLVTAMPPTNSLSREGEDGTPAGGCIH